MKPLIIGDLIVPVPIVQGGMGVGISMANLASAVANQGGIGVISAAGTGMFQKDRNKD
ncbi:MAG: nitronate monooxygenase, partial [Bacillota bacterium]